MTNQQKLVVTIIAFLAWSCNNLDYDPHDDGSFEIPGNETALCFDLSNDAQISASIFGQAGQNEDHTIILPFRSTSNRLSSKAMVTFGNYDDFSILHYKAISDLKSYGSLAHVTIEQSEIETEPLDPAQMKGAVYLGRYGLDRRFYYYEGQSKKFSEKYNQFSFDTLQLIAVKLPKQSDGKEISGGRTALPAPHFEQGKTKYFAFDSTDQIRLLQVYYSVPPSKGQKLLFEISGKVLGVLLFPLLQLLAGRSTGQKEKTRKKFAWVFGTLQIAACGLMVWFLFINQSFTTEKISDWISTIFSGLVGLAMFFIDVKPKT